MFFSRVSDEVAIVFRSMPISGLQQRRRQSGPSRYRKITPSHFVR